jgi:hypothetical protein
MRIDGSVRAALLKLIRDGRVAHASFLKPSPILTTLGAASLRSLIAQGCAGAEAGAQSRPDEKR